MNIRVRGSVVLLAMLEKGYGVRQTCERSGVNCKTLNKVLDGEMVRLDAIRRLTDALDIDPRQVLDFEEPGTPVRLRAVK